MIVVPKPMPAAPLRYLNVMPRPLLSALVVHRRYLIAVPRPFPVAALVVRRRYLAVARRPLPSAPLVVLRRYLIVVRRPLPAAALVVRRSNEIAVPRPMPAASHLYLAVVPKPLIAAPVS